MQGAGNTKGKAQGDVDQKANQPQLECARQAGSKFRDDRRLIGIRVAQIKPQECVVKEAAQLLQVGIIQSIFLTPLVPFLRRRLAAKGIDCRIARYKIENRENEDCHTEKYDHQPEQSLYDIFPHKDDSFILLLSMR